MITLNATTETLRVVLGGAVTTNELHVNASWRDEGGIGDPYSERGSANVFTTGATPAIIAPAPKAKYTRTVETLSVYNADTVAQTITIQLNSGVTVYKIVSFAVDPGFTLSYTNKEGWQVLSGTGALRVVQALTSPLPVADGGTGSATVADALDALEVNQNTIAKLATVAGIDAKAVAETVLYTVPAGLSAVITGIVIRVTAFTAGAKAVQAIASVGANGTFDDYLNSVTYTVAAAGVAIADSVLDAAYPVYVATDEINLTIETGSDATTETWAVDVFGYLV